MSLQQLCYPYIPIDRYLALITPDQKDTLPSYCQGAALFADISGFTPLSENLVARFGPRLGAEKLSHYLNKVYDELVIKIYEFGGSVIFFSGDAITCWFDEAYQADELVVNPAVSAASTQAELPERLRTAAHRAVSAALGLQEIMQNRLSQLLNVDIAGPFSKLALKVAVASGPAHRMVVGEPLIQQLDLLAGATLDQLAQAEHLCNQGEIVVTPQVVELLGEKLLVINEWRKPTNKLLEQSEPLKESRGFAVVKTLSRQINSCRWLLEKLEQEEPLLNLQQWILPAVYERIRAGAAPFLTELRPAVALFLNFSGLSYDYDSQAPQKLDEFIRWVQKIVTGYGGNLLDVTIGDKGSYLYCVFGAPLSYQNDLERAVRAGLELLAPPAEIAQVVSHLKLGATYGVLRCGTYGATSRHTYGVLGDEVNLAARLMQIATEGDFVVSEAVMEQTKALFAWEKLPPQPIKGKSNPLSLYRLNPTKVRVAKPAQAPSQNLGADSGLPLVGRETELECICQKAALALKGQGQIVVLSAEAGVGKSRLLAEAVQHLLSIPGPTAFSPDQLLTATCQSYSVNSPYQLWQTLVRQFFGLEETTAKSVTQIKLLAQRLAAINPQLKPRLPLLGMILSDFGLADNNFTKSLDAKLRKTLLADLLVSCFEDKACQQPLLIVLEDCHWLDPSSSELLQAVGQAIGDKAILLIITTRPGEKDNFVSKLNNLPFCTELTLTELTQAQAEQLLRHKLGQIQLSHELTHKLISQAEGNPFYLEELVNYFIQLGLAKPANLGPDAPVKVERVEEGVALPNSLHSLVLSRIDQLDEAEKVVVKIASIIGRLFAARWIWETQPQLGSDEQIKAYLARLAHLNITPLDKPEPDLEYLFKHSVIQQVAYESQESEARAKIHEVIAVYIEATYSEQLDRYLNLLTYHYGASHNTFKQRHYYRLAAQRARQVYANTTAIECYRRLLPLLEDEPVEVAAISLSLGQVLELEGQWEEAARYYSQALSLAAQVGDRVKVGQAQNLRGRLEWKRGNYPSALTFLEEAQEIFEELVKTRRQQALAEIEAEGLVSVVLNIGNVYNDMSNYPMANTFYERGLALCDEIADKSGISKAHINLGRLAYYQGDFVTAHNHWQASLKIANELNDKLEIANSLNNLGVVLRNLGRVGEASQAFEQSLQLKRLLGDKKGIGNTLNNLGELALYQQEYGLAESYLQESLVLRQQLGDKWGVANSLNNLGELAQVWQEDYTRARELLERSLAIMEELGNKNASTYVLTGLGLISIQTGDLLKAEEFLLESLSRSEQIGDKSGVCQVLSILAALSLQKEAANYRQALGYFQKSLLLAQELSDPQLVVLSLIGQIQLYSFLLQEETAQVDVGGTVNSKEFNYGLTAAKLCGSVDRIIENHELKLRWLERDAYSKCLNDLQKRLSAAEFNTQRQVGYIMDQKAALDYALAQYVRLVM